MCAQVAVCACVKPYGPAGESLAIVFGQEGMMSRLPQTLLVATTIALSAPAALYAQQDKQVVIQSATANRVSETLTIKGVNFGNSAPTVQLEESTLTVLPPELATARSGLPSPFRSRAAIE